MMDFPSAMIEAMYYCARIRRAAWRQNKHIWIKPEGDDSMSYPEIVYTDGSERRAPWQPNRCDMLEKDWFVVKEAA